MQKNLVAHKKDEETYKRHLCTFNKFFQPLYIVIQIVQNHLIQYRRWKMLNVVEQQRKK